MPRHRGWRIDGLPWRGRTDAIAERGLEGSRAPRRRWRAVQHVGLAPGFRMEPISPLVVLGIGMAARMACRSASEEVPRRHQDPVDGRGGLGHGHGFEVIPLVEAEHAGRRAREAAHLAVVRFDGRSPCAPRRCGSPCLELGLRSEKFWLALSSGYRSEYRRRPFIARPSTRLLCWKWRCCRFLHTACMALKADGALVAASAFPARVGGAFDGRDEVGNQVEASLVLRSTLAHCPSTSSSGRQSRCSPWRCSRQWQSAQGEQSR